MRRIALTLTATFIILTGGTVQAATPAQAPTTKGQQVEEPRHSPAKKPTAAQIELLWQVQHGAPPIRYWEAVAVCETNTDWRNPGTYGGGLGIYNIGTFHSDVRGTWERWGGEQFAPTPQQAGKTEQIVVANRIAMFGFRTWKRLDPQYAKSKGVPAVFWYDKSPTGFMGWGCIRGRDSLDPARWGIRAHRK